jgi:hypothetical protein
LRSATQARQFCGCILHFHFIRHRKQRRMASVALAAHVLQILLTQSDPLFVERAHASAQDAADRRAFTGVARATVGRLDLAFLVLFHHRFQRKDVASVEQLASNPHSAVSSFQFVEFFVGGT